LEKFKKLNKESCIHCGELFENNFEVSNHLKISKCVYAMRKEQTCALCLHSNTKSHRIEAHKLIECVLCGAHVRGLIYHIISIDHNCRTVIGSKGLPTEVDLLTKMYIVHPI
jgi:hypothetical protein